MRSVFIFAVILAACLACEEGYINVYFTKMSGDRCYVRVSDEKQMTDGLEIIKDIQRSAHCLNPGYYMIGCEGEGVVVVKNPGDDYSGEAITREITLNAETPVAFVEIDQIVSTWTTLPKGFDTPDFDKSKPITGEPAYPRDPTDHKADYECNQKGYLQYLADWADYKYKKCTPHNPRGDEFGTEADFQQRLEYFVDSCMKIHDWNLRNNHKYIMEFTYFADWHPDEFEEITTTKQRYSGIKTPVPSITPVYNNSNLRYLMPSLDPCDDVIEGRRLAENTLGDYICKPQNCSVTWAFAVTNSIEYAIKKLYLEEYDQIVSVALSAQELIDCVYLEHEEVGEDAACDGLPIAWGFDYIFEEGIAYRQYYPHTNQVGTCNKDLPDEKKYHIAGYEKPSAYNKLGLFELVMRGPTAVTLGLDPEFFQYYRSDRRVGPYFDTGFWRPSVYGVVVEYYQYEPEGSETYAEWPFFAIETRLRACDSMVFRLPIRETTGDANIAGIAGFAIRPIVNELIPTPEPPTQPPTTLPPTTPPPTPTPTPEPWFPIYDPFILGDNSNYATASTCKSALLDDTDVLNAYLAVRDAYPTKALKHTRVLALMGMTQAAVALFKESLSKQTLNPAAIDSYFYGDSLKPRYLELDVVLPLMELTQYTRPSRLVLSEGSIMREGLNSALQWMVNNRNKGYFVNLEFLQITRNKCANYQGDVNAGNALKNSIVGHLQTICEDTTNFPKLAEMDFGENAFSEKNDGFDTALINACASTSRVITIKAREVAQGRNTYPLMCAGADMPTRQSYWYYDLIESEAERAQCRYTWNWEFQDEVNMYGPDGAPFVGEDC